MSSTLVTMTCDDSIYRCQSTSGYFFSDKSFWWYKKVIASNGEDLREATVPDTA